LTALVEIVNPRISPIVSNITAGRACTMATDAQGGVHLIYVRQGVRYRYLTTEAGPFPND
jgi:hypothetical protein